MKSLIRVSILFVLQAVLFKGSAQQSFEYSDSVSRKTLHLNEVVICDQTDHNNVAANFYKSNRLSTTEDVMARMMGVSLIKRGAYGMEPVLRVYSAGQINLTINGMRIYGACTDKMDPGSIYIEPNNLNYIRTSHGAAGNETGSTLGGSMDMVTKQAEFSHCKKTYATGFVSYNSVNHAFNAGTALNMSFDKVAYRINGTYRKALNYRAGANQLISYSQYEKVNYGTSIAFKLPEGHRLAVDYVGDIGWNIGYPALTMDAGKAIANIASLAHSWQGQNRIIQSMETKVYFNHIFHSMDDTHRIDTLMHMDMPGWSYTAGCFTDLKLSLGKNNELKLRADYANNFSKAEMTMYPQNAASMFMLTLPDNSRHFAGIYLSDRYTISKKHYLQISARAEFMRAVLTTDFGRNQAKIFDNTAGKPVNRLTPSVNVIYTALFAKHFSSRITLAYGERSPNANELFGFYLYNRFDGYDYLGNAQLKNERTIQTEWNGSFESKYVDVTCAVFYNHIYNYIMGATQSEFYVMTSGAKGVKKYMNMAEGRIAGTEFRMSLHEIKGIQSMHTFKYSYAQLSNGEPMPLVPPLKCYHSVRYSIQGWHIQAEAEWALWQKRVNQSAEEKTTPAYGLLHLRTGYKLNIGSHLMSLSFAAENVLDRNYREHLDWGNVPRPGRNFILTLSYAFSQ